jgi:hypothetical protein
MNAQAHVPTLNAEQAQPTVISKFWKNRKRNEAVWVTLNYYQGHRLVDVRIYATGADGCDRPTPKGVSLAIGKLPDLVTALTKALQRANEFGFLDQGSGADE